MTVAELFSAVNLSQRGPVRWQTPICEPNAGVYVVALTEKADTQPSRGLTVKLNELESKRWVTNQAVVYIGQTTRQTLARRIQQFYRHKYGDRSPHLGGQAVKLLTRDLWVYWSPAELPEQCERMMKEAFKKETSGHLPFANRR